MVDHAKQKDDKLFQEKLGKKLFKFIEGIIPDTNEIKTLHSINLFLEQQHVKQYLNKNTDFLNLKNEIVKKISVNNSLENISFQEDVKTILSDLTQHNILLRKVQNINNQNSLQKLKDLNIEIDDKFELILKDNDEIHQHIDNIHKYIIDKQDEQGIADSFGIIAKFGQTYGHNNLVKIGITGYQLVSIKSSIDNIKKITELNKAKDIVGMSFKNIFSNLSNFANIGSAILSIASLFNNQPSDLSIMMNAISELSQQLSTLRSEMHERFDIIEKYLSKLYSLCINEFIEVKIINYRIENMLLNIENTIQNNMTELKNILSSINYKLSFVINNQQLSERYKILQEIKIINNKINGPFAITSIEFKELFTILKTYICESIPDNMFINGISENMLNIIKNFENNNNLDFNVNSIMKIINYENKICNPTIYAWLICIFMSLIQSRYNSKSTKRISKAELKEVQKVLVLGNIIKEFIEAINTYDKNPLFELYKQSVKDYEEDYQKSINNKIKEFKDSQKIKNEQFYEKENNKLKDKFKVQNVPITAEMSGCYHDAYRIEHNYDKKGRHRPVRYCNMHQLYLYKNKYLDILTTQINEFKGKYLGLFMEGELILPYPTNFNATIPEKIKYLEESGKGYFQLEYKIVETNFILTYYFVINDTLEKISLSQYKYNYDKSMLWFYWNGGNYSKGETYQMKFWDGIYEHHCITPEPVPQKGNKDNEVIEEIIYIENETIQNLYLETQKYYIKKWNEELKNTFESNEYITKMTYYYYILSTMSIITGLYKNNILINNLRTEYYISMTNKIVENKVFNYSLSMLNNIIEWYFNNCVDSNDLDNSIDNEIHLTEENKILKEITFALGDAMASVINDEQKREIINILQNRLPSLNIETLRMLTN